MKLRRPRLRRGLRSPWLQMFAAVGLLVFGAWLIAVWVVGLVLMLTGLLLAADAVLRDTAEAGRSATVTARERWRRTG